MDIMVVMRFLIFICALVIGALLIRSLLDVPPSRIKRCRYCGAIFHEDVCRCKYCGGVIDYQEEEE